MAPCNAPANGPPKNEGVQRPLDGSVGGNRCGGAENEHRYDASKLKSPDIKCQCHAGRQGARRERETHAGHQKRETRRFRNTPAHWRDPINASVSRQPNLFSPPAARLYEQCPPPHPPNSTCGFAVCIVLFFSIQPHCDGHPLIVTFTLLCAVFSYNTTAYLHSLLHQQHTFFAPCIPHFSTLHTRLRETLTSISKASTILPTKLYTSPT